MVLESILLTVIRWIHFVGAFTAIGALFTSVMVLNPVAKTLPAPIRGPLSVKLLPRIIRVQIVAALVLMAAGVVLAWAISGGQFPVFITTKWGLSILSGGLLTLIVFFNALLVAAPTIRRLVSLLSQPPPAPSAGASSSPEIVKLQVRMNRLTYTQFGLVLIILFLMGFAAHG